LKNVRKKSHQNTTPRPELPSVSVMQLGVNKSIIRRTKTSADHKSRGKGSGLKAKRLAVAT